MINDVNLPKSSKLFLAAYICVSLFAVFYIPTLIPGKLAASESYMFGYNNRVGFILFILLTAIGAIYSGRLQLQFPLTGQRADSVQPATFWKCMAGALGVCIVMYFLTARLGGFGESAYLINRVDLAAHGLRPYRDFEYAYGASFIYLPILLSKILHITIPNAYYLFWALNVLGGVWFLVEVINRIDYSGKHKNEIFLMLYWFMIPGIVSTGLNYAGLRFLSAPLFALLVFRSIRDRKFKSQISGSLLVVLFTAILLLISPEIGIVFGLGASAFFFLFYMNSEHKLWLVPYISMLFLLACLFGLANKLNVFYTLKSMGSGGFNFPIIPAPHILILFALTFLCACYLVFALATGNFRSNTVLVLFVSIPSLAGALGRCDPGHVAFYGIGIFIVGLLCISNSDRWWKVSKAAFVLIFIIFAYLSTLWLSGIGISRASAYLLLRSRIIPASLVERIMEKHYGKIETKQKLGMLEILSTQNATSDSVVIPHQVQGTVEIPFGYVVTYNPTGLDGGYYFSTVNAFSPKAVRVKISELAQNPNRELLLPEKYANDCQLNPAASRKLISILFDYPYFKHVVHTEDIYKPLCDYISENYSLIVPAQSDTYGYGIWARK